MDGRSFLTQQLPFILPPLVAYVIGIMIALIYFRRFTVPAILVLAACLFLIVVTLATLLIQTFLMEQGGGFRSGWMPAVAVVSSVLRSLGFGLILIAVFVGRGAYGPGAPNSRERQGADQWE